MDSTDLLPSVAWRSDTVDVTLVSEATPFSPAVFGQTVYPLDDNDPGAIDFVLEIGFFIKDFVGRTYPIIAVNVGGQQGRVHVSDDFRFNAGPQVGQNCIVYKSVGEGESPYLAPIYYRHLDESALEFSRQAELEILWRHRAVSVALPFTGVKLLEISDYQNTLAPGSQLTLASKLGPRPKLTILLLQDDGSYWERNVDSERRYLGGDLSKLDNIKIDLAEVHSGIIILSR